MFKVISGAIGQLSNIFGVYGWLSGGGAATAMTTAIFYWNQYPRVSSALLMVGLIAAMIFIYAAAFVPRPGTCWPPWWVWFRNPLRKISWHFGCVLQVGTSPTVKTPVVYGFTCSLRVNRGSIQPKEFYLESIKPRIPVKVQCGPTHELATNIAKIPSGQWHHCSAPLLPNLTREEFIRTYDGITLVFDYDNKSFRKRFTSKQLLQIIDFGVAFYVKPPAKSPEVKTKA